MNRTDGQTAPMTVTPGANDPATRIFLDHRELLFSVVYNMLGSVTDTEDVLQEVWLAWSPRTESGAPVQNPRAYLIRIAVNQALARRSALSRRRETYVGQWLPEPLLTTENTATDTSDTVVRAESFSLAVLVVLESLSPLERAVFVLHEVFGYTHPEIADLLGRSPVAVRQLAHRARAHVQARRPRHQPDPAVHARVTERFAAAALGGDMAALLEVLAPDVTLWTDGGGKGPATSLHPVHGNTRVAAIFHAVAENLRPGAVQIRYRHVNGEPSLLVFSGDSPLAVVVVEPDATGQRIREIYSITNPDKLSRVHR
ncbi:RNA polymerase sigma factor SigJ [Nocardia sp. 2]|uniref:RNA polymerase sigma factor SigJ n=2 Tax=Nocardia acididurans TaxID=2802282 RepID=A0ABS1MG49_9NOCA|nr:RNA polymerase sigma factor SigJ [Nocardia acididurans]